MKKLSFLSLLAFLALAVSASAESAKDVMEAALEKNDARLKDVEDFTVTQEMMGHEVTTYYVVETVDGHRFARSQQEGGSRDVSSSIYGTFPEMVEHAQLEGKESIDGKECWVLRVDDVEELDVSPDYGDDDASVTPTHAFLYFDTDEHLLRGMRIEGEMTREGRTGPMTMEMRMTDYRTVDGLAYPFRTVMSIRGMEDSITDEDREQARLAMEEMKAEMEKMDPEQRAMMEKMMGGQMEKMQEMLESGEMKFEIVVQDLVVNAGPPAG